MPWQYKILISCLNFCHFFCHLLWAYSFLEGLIPVSLQHIARVYQHLSKHEIFSSEIWGFLVRSLSNTPHKTPILIFFLLLLLCRKPSTKAREKCPEIQSGVCAVRDLLCHTVTGLVTGLTQKTWHDFHVALTAYIFYTTLLFLLREDKGFCTWHPSAQRALITAWEGMIAWIRIFTNPRNPRH